GSTTACASSTRRGRGNRDAICERDIGRRNENADDAPRKTDACVRRGIVIERREQCSLRRQGRSGAAATVPSGVPAARRTVRAGSTGTFLAPQGYVRWKRRAARALPPRRKGRRRTREEAVHWPLPDRLYEVLPGGGRRYGV